MVHALLDSESRDDLKRIDSKSLEAISTLLKSQNHGASINKKIALSFHELEVTAPAQSQAFVKTLPRAILNTFGPDQCNFISNTVLPKLFPKKVKVKNGKPILKGITGVVKPGEMLFVLGRPGSGCSTFLRTVADSSSLSSSGDLNYSGIPSASFLKRHPRETIYLPEEDRHIAALTVRETILFSLRTSLPIGIQTENLVEQLTVAIAKLLGLEHVLETSVGGQFFPGVSGGERKRVSIAEVLAAGSSVQCFDNSTRGLDSSTALDFVRALRSFTDIGEKTTLATLYQAGENIWDHFDKVLLLDEGYEAFFGPTVAARDYFEGLGFVSIPGQTTAEFLLSVTDPLQRKHIPGSIAERISSAEDLAAEFKRSSHFQNLQLQIKATHDEHSRNAHLPPGDSYNLSFPRQVAECLRREYQLAKRQIRVHQVKWITTIILCLACGSIYWDITNTAQGAYTRGGILFFALIFNGWLQFPELFDAHTNRPVLERQASLHLNRASAVAIARFLIDLPLIGFQHILFMIPFYFLTRLQLDAGKFFFFYLTMYLSTINFSNLLRMFAYYLQSLDDCFRYGGFSCTVLLLFAGFLFPAQNMAPYFGWIHRINPMYYAFENLFTNEFMGLTLLCDSPIPDLPGANSTYQSCAIRGATPGQLSVSGLNYLTAYGFSSSNRWRNIGILIGIAIAYLAIGVLGSEIMTFVSEGASITYVKDKSRKATTKIIQDVEKSAPTSISQNISSSSERSEIKSDIALTWNNLTVDIGGKPILRDISGYVRRGELTALCGASGAGKTTLLSALSQINSQGQLQGEVLVGDSPPGTDFRKTIGFAQQMDLHDGTATVREALEFSALLRQPSIYSKEEKLAYAHRVLTLLDLEPVSNALIGEEGNGLSVEQRRRVTIGVELASRPQLLFADEPTSGLDSQSASHIVNYLQTLARQGQAIIVTVHQPSALLFSQFDNLLVLSSEGKQLYFGRVEEVLKYFERQGASCPPGQNPAEFILETVGAGVNARDVDNGSDWSLKWKESPEAEDLSREIHLSKVSASPNTEARTETSEFNSSTLTQTKLLTLRMLRNQWRNTPYIYSKIWVHVLSAILVGFTFYNLGTSPDDLQNRAFSVYFILFLCNAIVNVILARFFFAGLYWGLREGPSRTYGWFAFCSASIFAEIPAAIFVTVIYFLIWYFPSGLPLSEAGYIFLFLLTYEIFQVLLGLFMMALSPDLGFAGNILVFILCTCNWFNGIIVPYNQIQVFWRYWLYYLSPFTYLLGGMVTAVISDVPVTCSDSAITHFNPPPTLTCAQYAGSWATTASAQLLNPTASFDCQVCRYTNGDQYLAEFNLGQNKWGGKWGYWAIFLLFTLTNLFLVYFFTWATKVKRWKLFYFL